MSLLTRWFTTATTATGGGTSCHLQGKNDTSAGSPSAGLVNSLAVVVVGSLEEVAGGDRSGHLLAYRGHVREARRRKNQIHWSVNVLVNFERGSAGIL